GPIVQVEAAGDAPTCPSPWLCRLLFWLYGPVRWKRRDLRHGALGLNDHVRRLGFDRFHRRHSRPREAGDQPGAAPERKVVPAPVKHDREPVSEPDQEIDVGGRPYQPGDETADAEAAHLHDRSLAADRRQGPEVPIAERRQVLAL